MHAQAPRPHLRDVVSTLLQLQGLLLRPGLELRGLPCDLQTTHIGASEFVEQDASDEAQLAARQDADLLSKAQHQLQLLTLASCHVGPNIMLLAVLVLFF